MGASHVRVSPDSTGKKLQTWENTIGADDVHTEAVTLTNSSGTEISPALEAGGNLATIAGDTTSLDGKVTACDTTALATEATLADIKTAVQIIDNSIAGSETQVDIVDEGDLILVSTTPVTYNVTMVNADTEYSQALPANTKKFTIHTRDESAFRFAYATGKVAGPAAPYFTFLDNSSYSEDNLNTSATLYFASADAGKIIEIIAWT